MKKTYIPKNRTEALIFIKENSNKNGRCLEYIGSINSDNYPLIGHNGINFRLNRIIYSAMFGDIPSSICVCHTCDNRRCIKPEHLILGTHSWNMFDKKRKKRQSTGVIHRTNSKLSEKDIRDIFIMKNNDYSQKEISSYFSVSTPTISNILRGVTWRHCKPTNKKGE